MGVKKKTKTLIKIFNISDIEGIESKKWLYKDLPPQKEMDNVIENLKKIVNIKYDSTNNSYYYSQFEDKITLLKPGYLESKKTFLHTVLHEVSHSTGHKSKYKEKDYWKLFNVNLCEKCWENCKTTYVIGWDWWDAADSL